MRKLGELAEIVRGASPRPIQDPKWFDEQSEIGWLRISDVTEQDGRIYHLEQKISKLGQQKTRVLVEPHLLLSIAATVGKPVVNYVKTGVHDGFLIFLEPRFEQEFMFQWLEMFRSSWSKYGQPGSQVNLNSDLVKKQELSIPSLPEQSAIGTFFSTLDRHITLHQRKLDKLKSEKQAYLSEMFPAEGERVPKRRFSGFTDDWELQRFSELVEIRRGLTYSPTSISKEGIRVLRSSNIDEDTFTFGEDDVFVDKWVVKIPLVKEGDILITAANGSSRLVGKHAIIKDLPANSAIHGGFMLLASCRNPEFVNSLMSSAWYTKFINLYVAGGNGAIGNLNKNDLDEQNVLVPNPKEQSAIGTFFSTLDQHITLHQRKLEKLKNLKKALLNELFV
ncbi:TPA: restriction endonuclease subunit S [Streptococcus suis]|nr:restriction endonuclease subunit S [Streptococcus suis]